MHNAKLSTEQPVLPMTIVLSFVTKVLKKDIKVLKWVSMWNVSNWEEMQKFDCTSIVNGWVSKIWPTDRGT